MGTYEQREGLLELGDLLLSKRISLRSDVSTNRDNIRRSRPSSNQVLGQSTLGRAKGEDLIDL
jgi:hypothetical protein